MIIREFRIILSENGFERSERGFAADETSMKNVVRAVRPSATLLECSAIEQTRASRPVSV